MKEPDAGTPQTDSRPTIIEAKCEGRRQYLNSPAGYSACNSHGNRLVEKLDAVGGGVSGGDLVGTLSACGPNPQIRTPVPEPVAAGLEHKEPQHGPLRMSLWRQAPGRGEVLVIPSMKPTPAHRRVPGPKDHHEASGTRRRSALANV